MDVGYDDNRDADTFEREALMSREQRQRHVLVVNDTPEILELFKEILEDEGWRVSLSSYVVTSLDDVKQDVPNLIILDYIIGGEALGWQMLQMLKMDRETADIPVIICTAAIARVRELQGVLKEKQVGVVFKPFDIDELLNEIRVCVGEPPKKS